MSNIMIRYVRLSEIKNDGGIASVEGFSVGCTDRQTFLKNPFAKGKDVVFAKIGLIDGLLAGQEYVFPLNMMINGERVASGSGGGLYVKEWARKYGLGLEFTSLHSDHRDGEFDVTDTTIP